LEDRVAEISPAACAVSIEDHLLVAECRSGDLRLFNPTAAFVWRRLEEGLSTRAIARSVAADFGVTYSQAEADVRGILEQWSGAGLAVFDDCEATRQEPDARAAGPTFEACRRGYRLGDARFEVRYRMAPEASTEDRRFLERVLAMLRALEDESRGAAGIPAIDLVIDGAHARAFGPFCRTVLQNVYGPFEWLFTMHAAGVGRGEAAIALVAAEGGGKSTLAAHLAASGWSYFADDLLTIDPRTSRALPLPVALGVKAASVGVLGVAYPGLERVEEHRYGRKAARYLAPPRHATAVKPAPLSTLVFTRFVAGADCAVERIDPAEAARRLMEAGVVFSDTLRPDMLGWLGHFLTRTPCYALQYSRLEQAEAALLSIA
jgi:hypothetical protein